MSTQLVAILAVLGLALLILFLGWGALVVSQREERDQAGWIETMAAAGRAGASAKGDYVAGSDCSDGSDYSDGSEHDDG